MDEGIQSPVLPTTVLTSLKFYKSVIDDEGELNKLQVCLLQHTMNSTTKLGNKE
jgi:hypothetical protein